MKIYPEYDNLDLPKIAEEVLAYWDKNRIFERSVSEREGAEPFVFYEGPPSANGIPGIHHVMARAMKDIFCRYQTLKGKQVKRKAGWDTHGLPIELSVEKTLGITKEDIGKKISIDEYNKACRKEVMKYTHLWEDVTRKMGYWVDMKDPYITYENKYIESVWWLLQQLYKKNLLYKGYSIQPYSPAAGTGLSSHELNQPGCYRNVKDRTATAMFKLTEDSKLKIENWLKERAVKNYNNWGDFYFLAWTTTPWTLPSNTALALGNRVDYGFTKTFHPFTHKPIIVVLAISPTSKYFPFENFGLSLENYKAGDKKIPSENLVWDSGYPYDNKTTFRVDTNTIYGEELIKLNLQYEQLLPYTLPHEHADKAFRVIAGDFVSTEDGTGIVHIAPTFGADDMRAAKAAGVPPMLVIDENGKAVPLVDLRGKFRPEMKEFAGEYVKADYLSDAEKVSEVERLKKLSGNELNDLVSKIVSRTNEYLSVDERLILKLEQEGKLFKKETYEHNYPHCWRTDKPVLYYPLDSWFIKASSMKDRMSELNKTINWKPESTGTGRFGEWLNNLQDWNLSRSRYWGIPLPIWVSEDKQDMICVGSAEELKKEIDRSVKAGYMKNNPLENFVPGNFTKENYDTFDLHRPYSDEIILERNGKKLFRELDLIDVWFDSGAMPYAQLHYPFENKELIDERKYFPADFIAEGVDQTRGWFYTLHAIAVMQFDSVAYKNVISNGLVLDKNGNKMSKRLGNTVDPFETLKKYGADATRWYMTTNASPWDNLKFNSEGIVQSQKGFFGTLYNTYSFFALYANIDQFVFDEKNTVPYSERTELDRWIISRLHSLVKFVTEKLDDYDPTPAARAIENFVDEHLSNWYVRLSRRRFWKGEMSDDKKAAYETLHECLKVVAQLSSVFAPFFSDRLYLDLCGEKNIPSVHLSLLPKSNATLIDKELEERMELAERFSSLVFSLRKKQNIRVRQPLTRIMIPVLDEQFRERLDLVKNLILSETNVKTLEFVLDPGIFSKKIKPDFKLLGKKLGRHMKAAAAAITTMKQDDISLLETQGFLDLNFDGERVRIERSEVEILVDDLPGMLVAMDGRLTVALDITMTQELREEGLARELVNRIQNIRKDKDFQVTDRIDVQIKMHDLLRSAVRNNFNYICSETLADSLELVHTLSEKEAVPVEVDDEIKTLVHITKHN
ncbi:MAG: isoleucine--tRNA ligase [Bacteroidetes bacterium]|nr:isoleucine--tRNA ligase [Bacteroidota bacterium]